MTNVKPIPSVPPTFRYYPENIGGNNLGLGYPFGRFPTHLSIMEDVVGKPGNFNPVVHFSIDSDLRGYPGFRRTGTAYAESELKDWLSLPYHDEGTWISNWPWLPTISAATLSGWSIDAYNAFNAQVPTKVSLANFLYELKDIKGLIPTISRSVTKTVSNNFLAFEFGVKPMISDIKAIVNLSADVDKRLEHLIAMQGKESHLSFQRSVVHDEPYQFFRNLATPLNSDFSEGHATGVLFKRISARTDFHVGAGLFQDLSDLADANAKLKALVAAGGFNHPARIIWNAIPYSFVLDWFFSIGKLLDTISVQPFGGTYRVDNVGYSVKTEGTYAAFAKIDEYPDHRGDDAFTSNALLGTVSVKSFSRRPGFPVYSPILSDGILSTEQLVLALAMLEQKRR